jgi:hypothetical protein
MRPNTLPLAITLVVSMLAPAICQPAFAQGMTRGDFNGDSHGDLAVGVPGQPRVTGVCGRFDAVAQRLVV